MSFRRIELTRATWTGLAAAAWLVAGCSSSRSVPELRDAAPVSHSSDAAAAVIADLADAAGVCPVRRPDEAGEYLDENGVCRTSVDAFSWCAATLAGQLGADDPGMLCQRCTLRGDGADAEVLLVSCPSGEDQISCYYARATGAVLAGAHVGRGPDHCGTTACNNVRVSTESVDRVSCTPGLLPCRQLVGDAGVDGR